MMNKKVVLTIAGSDSSGGAGIQADLKTMEAMGVYGTSVITAVTAQNTCGVKKVLPMPADMVTAQLTAVWEDIPPDAVKIGMLADAKIAEAVSLFLQNKRSQEKLPPVVIDPVLLSTSGQVLLEESGVHVLQQSLFGLAALLTPNIPEAAWLSEQHIQTPQDMEQAACHLEQQYHTAILLKGGHSIHRADDLLVMEQKCYWYPGSRIACDNTHGTGCTLSSAIACLLAQGNAMPQAIGAAKEYLRGAMSTGLNLGQGNGPLNHGWRREDSEREKTSSAWDTMDSHS